MHATNKRTKHITETNPNTWHNPRDFIPCLKLTNVAYSEGSAEAQPPRGRWGVLAEPAPPYLGRGPWQKPVTLLATALVSNRTQQSKESNFNNKRDDTNSPNQNTNSEQKTTRHKSHQNKQTHKIPPSVTTRKHKGLQPWRKQCGTT